MCHSGRGSTIKAGCLGGARTIGPHGTPETASKVCLEQLCADASMMRRCVPALCSSSVCFNAVFAQSVFGAKCLQVFARGGSAQRAQAELQTGQR